LELEEVENYRFWVLAGGKPKRFRWQYRPRRGKPLSGSQLGERVVQFARDKMKIEPKKGDVWHYAQAKGLKPVFKVVEDGVEYFVDENGKRVEMPKGHFFIPSARAQELAKGVRSGKG